MTRFAFAAAGTGGHVFPALAVADQLRVRGVASDDIVFFGGNRLERTAVPEAGYAFVEVPLQGLQRSLSLRNLRIPGALWTATRRIRAELRDRSARVMLATGGYVTVPAGWAARRESVGLYLQEQNAEPGLANRVARRWAREAYLAFPAAQTTLPGRVTGNPLRAELADFDRSALVGAARRRYGLPAGRPVLGVLGGSLGAGIVNEAVTAFATSLGDAGDAPAIVHIAGPAQAEDIGRRAAASGAAWRVLAFEDEMQYFYAAADLVLGRSGAVTVSELAATASAAVLVPRAAGSAKHQDANAAHLASAGAALVVGEDETSGLPALLAGLLADPSRLEEMAAAAGALGLPDAAARIADDLLKAAGG